MSNISFIIKQNIINSLGSENLSAKRLSVVIMYIIDNVPISNDFLARISRLLKESED